MNESSEWREREEEEEQDGEKQRTLMCLCLGLMIYMGEKAHPGRK